MDEKMNQIFVGKKYNKFEKKVFSFPAFFFGGIYFAYRKMLLHGILLVLISTIFNTFVQKTLNFGLSLLASLSISIAVGLYFPIWYRDFYRKKVQKIQLSSSNLTEDQLILQLQKNGGTSVLFVILFIILSTSMSSIISSSLNKIILPDTNSNISSDAVLNNINSTITNPDNDITNSDNTTENEDPVDTNSQDGYLLGINEDTLTLVELNLLKLNTSAPEGEVFLEIDLLFKNNKDELITINYKENDTENVMYNNLLKNRQYKVKFEAKEVDNNITYSLIEANGINSIVDNEFSKTFLSKVPDPSNKPKESGEFKVLEKVKIYSYSSKDSIYQVYINDDVFECSINNYSLLNSLDYTTMYDELFANIYYTEENSSKKIAKIELCNIITDEILSDISDEDAIRESLGYHLEGSYNETFTLVEIDDTPGNGQTNSIKYKFYNLIFQSEKDKKQYSFMYKIFEDTINRFDELEKGKKYKITFDVEHRFSDYDYVLTDFEEI